MNYDSQPVSGIKFYVIHNSTQQTSAISTTELLLVLVNCRFAWDSLGHPFRILGEFFPLLDLFGFQRFLGRLWLEWIRIPTVMNKSNLVMFSWFGLNRLRPFWPSSSPLRNVWYSLMGFWMGVEAYFICVIDVFLRYQ